MRTAEFQIINGGQRHSLGFNNRIVIEFISGHGQGDQSYWCEFVSIYKAYRQKGTKLEECGSITETSGTDRKSFKGEIDGKEVYSDFLTANEVFTRIEKIKKS